MSDAAIEQALDELREAIAAKRVEPICAAYQALRNADEDRAPEEMLRLAEEAVDESVEQLIVSAYSHRLCFMCDRGTVPCSSCDATGRGLEGSCPTCRGLGRVSCNFCRATGWPDTETIPTEVREPVLERKLTHVRREIRTLEGMIHPPKSDKLPAMSLQQKRALGVWLIRLDGRVRGLVRNAEQAKTLRAMIVRCAKLLEPF